MDDLTPQPPRRRAACGNAASVVVVVGAVAWWNARTGCWPLSAAALAVVLFLYIPRRTR